MVIVRSPDNPDYDPVTQGRILAEIEANKRAGYVYLIRPVGHNVYKIGCAVDLDKRLIRYKSKYAFPIELVAAIYYSNYTRAEHDWHMHYSQYCLANEWFVLPESEVEYFKSLTS